MAKPKKAKDEEVAQIGVEDAGVLDELISEHECRVRQTAILNRIKDERKRLETATDDLRKAEHRVHLAAALLQDNLFTVDDAKQAVLHFKIQKIKPNKEDKEAIVGVEIGHLQLERELAKMAVAASEKDYEMLEGQMMYYASVRKNEGPVTQMGSLADQMYSGRTGVPLAVWEDEPKTPTLGGPFSPPKEAFDAETTGDFDHSAPSGPVEVPETVQAPDVAGYQHSLEQLREAVDNGALDPSPELERALESSKDHQLKAELEASMKEPDPVLSFTAPAPELAPAAKAEIAAFGAKVKEMVGGGFTPPEVTTATAPPPVTVKFPADPVAKTLADMITTKQLGMIRAVARNLGLDADEECYDVMSCKVDELTRRGASALIDHLKALEEGPRDDENEAKRESLFRKGPIPGGFVDSLYGGSKPQVKLSDVRDPSEQATEPQLPTEYRETDGKIVEVSDDDCPF